MPTIADAYDQWADQYDTDKNKTRDLEGHALRTLLGSMQPPLGCVLEIGCGTGKNSAYFVTQAQQVLGVDFSLEMLARAQAKVRAENIRFEFADITQTWGFTDQKFDLVTFSLVLEHIADLRFVFEQAFAHTKPGGLVYVGELHPFKQYQGSQARFDTPAGRVEVPVHQHHITEFIQLAKAVGLHLLDLSEWFDEDDKTAPPRILTLLLQKMQLVS